MGEAGWNLKKGDIKKEIKNVNEILKKTLYSKNTTCYKYLLLKFILENIENNKKEYEFEEVYMYILNEFYFYFTKYKEKINLINKKSSLYLLLQNKKLENITKKDLSFLKKYVFGALYNDTEGQLFGFSKEEELFYLSNNLQEKIDKKIMEELKEKLMLSLGLENFYEQEYNFKENDKFKEVGEEKIKMEAKKYYQQKFPLEIDYILKKISTPLENGNLFFNELKEKSRQEMADNLGIGLPKLLAELQYMSCMNLYDGKGETEFSKKISNLNSNHDYIEPLLYYYLVKNENYGHYVYSELMNEVIYKLFYSNFEAKVSLTKILDNMNELNKDRINKKDWDNMVKRALNCLIDSETGFGKMGILEVVSEDKKNTIYELHSYWVEPLVGAYIIYDMWKEGQTTMEISSIINDKYNIGRIFLMDSDAIMETLEEIKALGLIDINSIAGLNQITKSNRYTKEDILDMMIEQA